MEYVYKAERDEYPDWWNGRAILCHVRNKLTGPPERKYIIGIDLERVYDFIDNNLSTWMFAEPVKVKKTVRKYLDPVSMMKWLVDHGYEPLGRRWHKENSVPFISGMWKYCGKEVCDNPYQWNDEWIEEVEE